MLQRRKPIKKNTKCSNCGRDGHTSIMCWYKRRQPVRHEADKTKKRRLATTKDWYVVNPPDKDGFYTCYLQISPYCTKRMRPGSVSLEHVYPKVKYPELRFYVENLKASCEACNKLKLSNTINQLCKFFPRLVEMVATPEWQAWEDQMEVLVKTLPKPLAVQLDRPQPDQQPRSRFPRR